MTHLYNNGEVGGTDGTRPDLDGEDQAEAEEPRMRKAREGRARGEMWGDVGGCGEMWGDGAPGRRRQTIGATRLVFAPTRIGCTCHVAPRAVW